MQTYLTGKLIIKPVRARLTRDTEWFGYVFANRSKMDPYVRIECGMQRYKTKTHSNAGKNPSWYDIFEMQRTNEDTIYFHVYDEDVGKDDHVGTATFSVGQLLALPSYHFTGNIPLYYKSKSSGEIYVDITFHPNQGAMPQPGYPPAYPQPGYPQPGYPQPGYPQPGYPQPGFPQPGFQQPAYPSYPPQGYPQQPYPQPGFAQPGMGAAPGYPQGYPQPGAPMYPTYHPRPY